MATSGSPARCAVLVGPYSSGKTTLLEAMLYATGDIRQKGSINNGSTVGDSSPEARARVMSVEPNFAHARYLDDDWAFIDCPGSVELASDAHNCLMVADVAVIVAEPDPDRAVALAPMFKFLEARGIPHMLFINKMDRASMRVRELLAAFQSVSSRPLVLRQVPMRDTEHVTGLVDLVSDRAWKFQEGKQSELIEVPEDIRSREEEARQEMLESLADFDDALLEQLLEDKVPTTDEVYAHLGKQLAEEHIVPVFMGSAEHQNGIHRLLKALRHETPAPNALAERLGISAGPAAITVKTTHQQHAGKMSFVRVVSGELNEGMKMGDEKLQNLLRVNGGKRDRIDKAVTGDVIALTRIDSAETGKLLANGAGEGVELDWPEPPPAVLARAIHTENRQDDVKLSSALQRLTEEDPSFRIERREETGELLLWGQGEIHLRLATDWLKSKYNVAVTSEPPQPAYRETIRKGIVQHSRFKRQTGGHGQFGDVHIEIKPLGRGEGFQFIDKIVGGVIPRQFIPAVENGVREYLVRGPLGFPVVDLEVTLFDGKHHPVDSSEIAFKTAGRMAMSEGMQQCGPVLLEPIFHVTFAAPSDYTSKINSLITGRRGQILGFDAREGWDGWDEVWAHIPEAELQDIVIELRSLTQGTGSFTMRFDHLAELSGREADQVVAARKARLEENAA
ncbi:MAG: elongation factor G [Alphaproteobacteria bacterium]|nr:elongation factor G [Alphaproteobacteria bacterium]